MACQGFCCLQLTFFSATLAGMSKYGGMTVTEFARLGGFAVAKKLTPQARRARSRKGGLASGRARRAKVARKKARA